MTTVIDERVVEMRFNNADFEKNVAQSMNTLEKLKKALNFDSAKSLENMGKASKNFSMESVGNQVETVQAKFSALQVVGMTALSEITKTALNLGSTLIHKVIDPIASGGMNRALNIENAKFQLEGLKVAWDRISDDINYGVKDTAYGLDSAAKAAAQLVTSGVEFGKEWGETGNSPMAKALRGISGVAAMTNSTYDDIAEIYTSISGKGKMMTQEFNRLGQRGLNAAASMADYFNQVNKGTVETSESVKQKVAELSGGLHVTEQDIKEFAKKSQIDFELFSYAMDEAFGEHAKEANKTFTGALSNVKAALSRIGANFATPYLENARKIFVDLIGVINSVNKALDPVYKRASTLMKLGQMAISEFLNSEGLKTGITTIINALVRGFDGLVKILSTVKVAFESVFPKNGAGETFLKVADAISAFIDKVVNIATTTGALVNLFSFFQGIFNVGKLIIDIFKAILQAIIPVEHPLAALFTITLNILGVIGRVLTAITTLISQNLSLSNVLSVLSTVLGVIRNVLLTVGAALGGAIIFAINNFGKALNWVLSILKDFSHFITNIFNNGIGAVTGKFEKLTNIFNGFSSNVEQVTSGVYTMEKNYGAAGDAVAEFGTLTREATKEVDNNKKSVNLLILVLNKVKTAIQTVVAAVAGAIAALGSAVFGFFADFRSRFTNATQNAKGFLDYIKGFFVTIGSYFGTIGTKIAEFFTKLGLTEIPIVKKLKEIGVGIADFIKGLDSGKITAIAFAAAMTGLVVAAIKVATSFSTLITSVRRVFTTVESILKSKFFTTKQPSIVIQLAEAFAIMAVSLALLTNLVDADELAKTSAVMKDLMITFTICAGALRVIDFVISKMGLFSNFKLVNSTILSLAVSMGILVAAFAVLNKVEIAEDWSKKLLIMAVMFAEVGAAAVIISKFAPKLAGGSILMLTLALAMKTMVDAFSKITSEQLDNITQNIAGFTAIFLAVAALTAAAGSVRLTSAIGLYLIAQSFNIILPMISQSITSLGPLFETMDNAIVAVSNLIDKVKNDFLSFVSKLKGFLEWIRNSFSEVPATILSVTTILGTVFASLGALAAIIGSGFAIAAVINAVANLGKLLIGFGVAVIGLAVAIKIVVPAFIEIGDYLKELNDNQTANVLAGFATLAIVLTAMVGIITLIDAYASLITRNAFFKGKTVRTSFLGIGAAFAGIALAINLVAKALNSMEKLPEDRFWDLIKGVSLILVAIGVAAAGAGIITKGGSALLGLIGVVAAFSLVLAEVAILSSMWSADNDTAMKAAFAGLIVIAASISAVILSFSRLKNPAGILSLMIPALAMLVTVAGLIYAIGNMKEFNIPATLVAVGGLLATILVITHLLEVISRSSGLGNVKKIGVLVTAIGLIAAVATAIVGLALVINYTGSGAIIGAMLTLNAQLIIVIGIMSYIANMPSVGSGLKTKLKLLVTCIGALAAVALIIGGFAAAIKGIGGGYITGAMVALNFQLGLIVGMFTYIAKMRSIGSGLKSKIALLGVCIGALAVVALTIGLFAAAIKKIGASYITGAMVALNVQLGLIIAMMYTITKLNVADNFVRRIVLLGTCIGAMVAVAISLAELAKVIRNVGVENFNAGFKALATVFGELGLLLVAVGAVAGLMDTWSKTVGAVGLIVAGIAAIAEISFALTKLSEIDPGKLNSAVTAMGIMIGAMGALTLVAGVLQILLVGIGSLLGSAAGGWAGAVALPLLIVSIGTSVALMGAGLYIGAKAIEVLATALGLLVEPLRAIAQLPMAEIVLNLGEFGVAMLKAGAGLAVFDIAAAGGVVVIALLAVALSALNKQLPTFTTEAGKLVNIDLSGIAGGLVALGLAGLVLGAGAPGVSAYATALGGLAGALNQFSNTSGGVAAIKETGEVMETFTYQMEDYGALGATNYAYGTLSKEGEVRNATQKMVNGQVEIIEEEIPKAAEVATDEFKTVLINGTEYTYDECAKLAQKYGYYTTDGFIKAAEKGMVNFENKGVIQKGVEKAVEGAKKVATQGAEDTVNAVKDKVNNFNLGDLLSKLPSQFGSIGTLCGAALGNNASQTAAQIISKMLGNFNWMFKNSISQFGANGMPTDVMNKMYKGMASTAYKGVEGNLFNSFLSDAQDIMSNIIPTAKDTESALGGVGEGAGKGSKGVKDLADSLRSGLDLFSKFEVKTEMTSEQLLENMKSNIDGYASWSHRMTVLAERFADHDIPVTLLEKLKEDGPKQQEAFNAIYNMTDQQLDLLKERWEVGMNLPESQAAIVGQAFTYMGEMATQGFSDALNDHKAAHDAAHGLGKAAVDGVAEAIDAHSPSRKTFQLGVYMTDGLGEGMTSASAIAMLELCISQVCEQILSLFDENLSTENMGLVGETVLERLFTNAMTNMKGANNPIISAFAEGLMQLEPVTTQLTIFVETVISEITSGFMMSDINSPSEVFYQVGRNSILGFANGISNNTAYIRFAITVMCTAALATLNSKNLADSFYEVGKNATLGFANGIADSDAADAVRANAQAVADEARRIMEEALGEESPSKVMRKIGMYATMGFAIGLTDAADNVHDAALSVAEGTIDDLNTGAGRIQDAIDETLDFNPVITPMLDLSVLYSQMADVNSMFNTGAYNVYGQNGGHFSANADQPNTINFTQNNYSPKELSRYDIYRNTRNQINMMKGVIAHA